MKQEKHIYTVMDSDNNGQVYQLMVTRDKKNNINIHKMYIMVLNNGVYTKIMLNMDAIADEIRENPDRNVDDDLEQLCEEEFNELEEDINNENQKIYGESNRQVDEIDINSLLDAAEKANKHSLSYEDIIASIDQNGTQKK